MKREMDRYRKIKFEKRVVPPPKPHVMPWVTFEMLTGARHDVAKPAK